MLETKETEIHETKTSAPVGVGGVSQRRGELPAYGKVRRARLAALFVVGALAAALGSGCIVSHDYGPTEVAFEETTNLGYFCGGPLTSWTVTNRETGDQGTAGCEQPVLFTSLAGGRSYTFDIQGFSGARSCWDGTCSVFVSTGGRTVADCSSAIVHTCGL